MKKLLAFITSLMVAMTMVPATAFAGGSAAQISIANGNPSGYVRPGDQSTVMKFNVHASMDILIRRIRVDIDGSGTNYVGTLDLVDENGMVWDSIDAVEQHYFSPWYNMVAGQDEVFSVVAHIPQNADQVKNLSFDVSIGEMDVINPNTANSYSTYPATLQGSTFNFGGLFSADANFANFQAVEANRKIVAGEGAVISSFSIGYVNPTELESISIRINGNGQAGVQRVYIKDANGVVITSGLLNNNNEVTLVPGRDISVNGTKFSIYVLTNYNAVPGTTIRSEIFSANIVTEDGNLMWLGNDLPYTDNTFKVVAAGNNVVPPVTPVSNDDYEEPIYDNDLANPFSDISSAKAKTLEGRAALYLSAKNIIRGYLVSSDPVIVEFKGWRQLNRAEAVKFIVNSLSLDESKYCHNSVFPDVPADEWYTKYVCTAHKLGIVSGNSDGTFDPARNVNKAEFVKMLVEAHNLATGYSTFSDVKKTDWYAKYAGPAQSFNMFPDHGDQFRATMVLNRWETAVAVYQVMTK